MRDKLNLLSLPTSRSKILYFLSNESRKNRSKYFTIDFNITELAQFLNLNRSSLSRELSKLKKKVLLIITIKPSVFYNFIYFDGLFLQMQLQQLLLRSSAKVVTLSTFFFSSRSFIIPIFSCQDNQNL